MARLFLAAHAELASEIAARVAASDEAIRSASTADPAVGELWAEVHSQRRIGAPHVVWR